jgi:hypothetical protein
MISSPPNRRRISRVPCASAAAIESVMGVVLNASLGGIMVRIESPVDWAPGDRLTVTIDVHDAPLIGEVVSVREDRLSIRFSPKLERLHVDAEDCVITLSDKRAHWPIDGTLG